MSSYCYSPLDYAHHRSARRAAAFMGLAPTGHEMGVVASAMAGWYPGRVASLRRRLFALLASQLRADDSDGWYGEMGDAHESEGDLLPAFRVVEASQGDFRGSK